ncbi:proprotein convertase P-domain-containing protein [Amylibacter sp. IMCC11727]|uniref:proprotein convertase P-domain-containing protein n=1 Tax=Amylibacter sp. IMCC11727 TaxID=3039851 RepID=UPI003263C2EE
MTFNISYGFGMVDAFAAVRMAEAWLTMNGDAQTSANEVEESFSVTDNQTISDFNTITSTLSVSATLRAEDLTVWIDFTHTYVGDLTITLIGPNGESLVLSERQGGGANITTGWAFGVTSLLGTDSVSGTWTLSIQDSAGGDTGFLNSWGLDFYGSTANTNTIHHITDDFFTLSRTTGQTGRQVIADTNGGNDDWINMSAIAGSIFLDLDHTGTNHLRVDGINWATLASGTVIENAYGGDGDDQIRGNSANNEIHGARGNDDLRGYAGNDLLIGGVGDDTLRGQGGADTLEGNAGDDRLEGGDGKDVLKGHNGEDRLFGGSNDDRLLGGNNEDLLKGGDGKDILEGGKGSDVLEGGNGKDTLEGNGGHDLLEGNNGDDLLKGHDGNDVLKGHNSDDTLFGGNGGDKLLGGNGNDRLYGGKGNDTLTGGDHADRFYFSNNDDQDTITDFVNNSDTIYFNDNLWTGTRSVQDVIDDFGSINGGNAEFDFGDGDILIIEGVTNLGQLTNDIEIF